MNPILEPDNLRQRAEAYRRSSSLGYVTPDEYDALADEIERLRSWVACPEHGPLCGADACCCADKHQPGLVRGIKVS